MAQWSISEIGRKVGLRASAIRYYEQIGILEPARRVNGQRRYDDTVLYLAGRGAKGGKQAGFSLDEIRQLFFGFSHFRLPISQRWKQDQPNEKLVELGRQGSNRPK